MRSERRLVTALFADISGFSELTGRVDAEDLLEVIDPVVSALSNVVGRFGGVVEKYAGDAILALFGAPVAHDDDAARALRAADAMHRELAALVPGLGVTAAQLRLHIGVNSGHGIGRVMGSDVRLDYGVLGDVVVLAQRLEAAAPPGETYVGEATYELTRTQFELEPLGELAVKGKPDPVPAWRLVGVAQSETAPHPGASAKQLAGRTEELTALGDLVERLNEGQGGAGFVIGEAGSGKTMLCASIRRHAEAAGLEWLAARCLSYGGELAYWPFADLLRRLFGVEDGTAPEALPLLEEQLGKKGLSDTLPFVAALCGLEAAPATDLGAQSFQVRLHESVVAVLRAFASDKSTILHLDDLHWADGPTVELLRKLLQDCNDIPLLVLVSSRPEAVSLVDELAAVVPDATRRIELEPLGESAVRDIAAGVLGGPPSSLLAAELLERTRGNPFFVEEITRSLLESRELVKRAGEWHTRPGWEADQVPLTIEGILAARVDALGEPERDALELLSIIGRRADGDLARAVNSEVDSALPALVTAGLLDPPEQPRYVLSFHHPLIQQVVYARLLRRRRARLHTLVGEAAERLYGVDDTSVDLFARHFYLGEEPPKAYPYLVRAADRAERLFANEQALTHLRRALELIDAGPDQDHLTLRCARLEEVIGRYTEALQLYRTVLKRAGDFRAALGEISTLRKLGEYDSCDSAIARARTQYPEPMAAETAALALEEGWLLGLQGLNDQAVAVLEAGLTVIANQDRKLEAQMLVVLGRQLEYSERRSEALEAVSRARLLFEQAEDLPRLAMTLRVLGGIQHEVATDDGERRHAAETLRQAQSLARRVGNAEEQAASSINLAVVLADLGEYEAALEADHQSLSGFLNAGLKAGVACAYCNLADHLGDLGRWQEGLEAARDGLAVAKEIDTPFWITGALNGIARCEFELGNHRAAARAAEQATDCALAHGFRARARYALGYGSKAHQALGNVSRAQELEQRSNELAEP